MLIHRVELTNYKSYTQASIDLRPGTNAIIGRNGAGKSSVLEAVGLVLFNYRPSPLANCVREGADSARVAVRLTSSFDERDYEVEREFNTKTTTRYRVYDLELGGSAVAEGNDDVQAWLRQHLCVSPAAALEALFEHAVGVPQGAYTAPFLQSPALRKGVFNPLLQVEEYGQASDRLLEAHQHLTRQMAELDTEVAHAQGQLLGLPNLVEEALALEGALARLAREVAASEEDLSAAQDSLAAHEAQAARAQDAAWRVERLLVEAGNQERLLGMAQQAHTEALAAVEQVQASRAGHEAFVAAEERLDELEAQRAARDGLALRAQAVAQEQARLAERSDALTRAIAQIDAYAARLDALAPRVREQEALEEAVRQAQADAHRLALATQAVTAAAAELARARADLEAGETGAAQAAALHETIEALRHRHEELSEEGRVAAARRAAAAHEVQRLHEQGTILTATTEARCPVCEGALAADRRELLIAQGRTQHQALARTVSELDGEIERLRGEYRRVGLEIKQGERVLRELPGDRDLLHLVESLRRREQTHAERQAVADALAGAPAALEVARQQLASLGDPRRQAQSCEDQIAQRATLDVEVAEVAVRAKDLDSEALTLAEQLGAYADLDGALRQARSERAQHADSHATYLANAHVADQEAERGARVAEVTAEVARSRKALEDARREDAKARAAYDADGHQATRERVGTLQQRLAGLRAEQAGKGERHALVCREVDRLEALRAVLETRLARRRGLERSTETLRRVRELLRQAGPYVTQQLVRRISAEASRLYGDIMGDYAGRLQWSEDYEVSLDVRGRQRTFRQLSGGEQMAAALAVRLAALRETSAIDVAFFDEPTAHLDPERRDSLADQIVQVKGFSQMLVISHDDTFERAAQHNVRIVKDERGSHPERE